MKVIRIIDRISDILLEIALIVALLIGGYSLWDSKQVYDAADASNYATFHPTENDTASFDELRRLNPEVFAWLTVNDTPIDYPVAQADDNSKYINTNAEGHYALSGAIFLDYRNSPSFDDFNSIFYGHHMEQKMMFGSLSDFAEQAYFDSHPYGNLFFDGKDHGLEFFALILTDAYDDDLLSPAITGEDQRKYYLNRLLERASLKRNIPVSEKDQLVLLSTCTSEITNGRYVLVGKISEQLHLQERPAPVVRRLDVSNKYANMLTSLPVLVWIALAAALMFLLLHSDRGKDRKNNNKKIAGKE